MASKKLLRLTWVDETGEAYHTQDVPPRVARELMKRVGAEVVNVSGVWTPLRNLTRRGVEQSSRGATAMYGRKLEKTVLITLPEDNPNV